MRTVLVPVSTLVAALVTGVAALRAGPSRFGFSDRIERHYFPEVTTGPAEPSWSPDGDWIAFSMQGDIWKVPAEGGEAVALTSGPWYYFEPAWSPDGRSIAFTVDTGGNLDVGMVGAEGGTVTRLTDDPAPELNPTWVPDGSAILFAGAAGGSFDIHRIRLADRSVSVVVGGPGNQIQPAVSPDGRTLAYVAPVRGRLGTGGIWTQALGDADGASGEPELVHYDEAEYRTRPRWMPDGRALLFGSDEAGSNDIALVSMEGGNSVFLTHDPMGEFSAAPSPGGGRFAFVSNRTGPTTLYTAPAGGGPTSSWHPVEITGHRPVLPTGLLRGSVVDEDGRPVAARVQLVASDGRSYAPQGGFARVMAVTETHYFHTPGRFEVELPAGPVDVVVLRGPEFEPVRRTVEVASAMTSPVTLRLRHSVDMPALGWYSGDTHAHAYHQGRFGLSHESLFLQSLAEDLHVTHVLIHMDGTRLMGRWADLTGAPSPVSTTRHLLQFSQEFRGSLGHVGMLGLKRFILPLVGGASATPYAQPVSDGPYFSGTRAQGGLAGFMHPYLNGDDDDPASWSGSLIPVDVALGRGDFYDVASLYSNEEPSTRMYHRFLNAGFRLPATGGTDNFPDVWRDPPPGTDRTYARVEGPLSVDSWLEAVRAGRTFATTGPLVLLDVEGKGPGEELRLWAGAPDSVRVRVRCASVAPLDLLDLYVNGEVAAELAPPRPGTGAGAPTALEVCLDRKVSVPRGGWIAAVVRGPTSRYLGDSHAFAHTSPVYVVRDDEPPFRSEVDARFLADVVEAIGDRVQDAPWRSRSERDAFEAEIDQARSVYLRIATDAASGQATNRGLLLDPSNPEWRRPSPPVWYARFETTKGSFVVECVRERAPNSSDRFYNLIRLGYYDDTRFHRATEAFVQFGLHGDPAVNAAWLDRQFVDDPRFGRNVAGSFAFARDTVPGTANTQIFINTRDNPRNDRDPFAIFGQVIEGMDVVRGLYSGYGERSGSGVRQRRQGAIVEGGNAYLDRTFPLLDHLIRARILEGPQG
jgi:TolB protein